ncbi:Zinc finger protein, partial [Armadillidium vulgare]
MSITRQMEEQIKDNLEEDAKNDQQITGFEVNQYCEVIKDEVIIKEEPIEETVNEDLNHSQHFVKVEEDYSSNANTKREVEADDDPLKVDEKNYSMNELPFESVSRLENCQMMSDIMEKEQSEIVNPKVKKNGLKNCKNKFEKESQPKKIFKCTQCLYECKRKSSFKVHLLKHSNVKMFKCSACSFECNVKRNLKNHILSLHSDSKLFKCSYCSYGCNYKRDFKLHMLK